MSSPACASGSAATPPTAPRPTMTTSTSLSLVAMAHFRHRRVVGGRFHEHVVVVGGLMVGRQLRTQSLLLGRHDRAHARIREQVPADEVGVAAVKRIAKGALNRVGAYQAKKSGGPAGEPGRGAGLDIGEDRVLLGRWQLLERSAPRSLRELVKGGQSLRIGWTKRGEGPAEGLIDVPGSASLDRPRSVVVARDQ